MMRGIKRGGRSERVLAQPIEVFVAAGRQLREILLTRGLWLLLLEMTVIRFGWLLHVDYHRLGISVLLLFVVIRGLNGYGDPVGWLVQPVWYRTLLSFINVGKYPPSLDFLLVTLGPVLLLLAAFKNRPDWISRLLLVYGRVPLFFYILHLYLLRVLSGLMYTIFQRVEGYSFLLPVVYGIWLTAVVLLYLPCRWFMNYKQTHRHWWLSYL